jgi:hypothetical protein
MNKYNWNISLLVIAIITFIILFFWKILTGEYDLREKLQFDTASIYKSIIKS